jgi:hypothetical protein
MRSRLYGVCSQDQGISAPIILRHNGISAGSSTRTCRPSARDSAAGGGTAAPKTAPRCTLVSGVKAGGVAGQSRGEPLPRLAKGAPQPYLSQPI